MTHQSAERLLSQEMVDRHLRLLLRLDPSLQAVHALTGNFPPRLLPAGFAGLARVVCGQQVSVASANALWKRLEALPGGTTPEGFLLLGEKGLKGVGLSKAKFRTVSAIATACAAGELNLASVSSLPADKAMTILCSHKGIGPWTAEIYLMFCAGHPDIFPLGDIALQKAVAESLALPSPMLQAELSVRSANWMPYRTTAALLFWRFYAVKRGRQALPA